MKTLVNKNNPQIRISAPNITLEGNCYYLWAEDEVYTEFWERDWTLVEEENMKTIRLSNTTNPLPVVEEEPEVNFKVEERKWVHNAVDNIFPEDGDFMSEVDFRKIIKDTARHFYELGRKGGSK